MILHSAAVREDDGVFLSVCVRVVFLPLLTVNATGKLIVFRITTQTHFY